VKIVKNERDPPLFTGKLVIKFQNILRKVKRGGSLSFLTIFTFVVQHVKIYIQCNFEVNLITHLGVIALFSLIF
jgi:hypothetical protein